MLIKFIKLSTWWMPQTSDTHIRESRQFESMYTLQGKTWATRNMHSMLNQCMVLDHMYLTWSTHSNLSWSHQQWWTEPLLPRKRASDTIHNTIADRSVGPYPISLPSQPLKQWGGGKSTLCWCQVTRLTGRIAPTCDRYIQYLLTRANSSVLNRHRWGLQPWRRRLSTYHSSTFPIDDLPFPPTGPTRSLV
jgi:hypothetical protein